MRNTQALDGFLSRWGSSSSPDPAMLFDYAPLCRSLMFEDEDKVRAATDILKRNVSEWARRESPIYRSRDGILDKSDLLDKSDWYVDGMLKDTQPMATSGSLTGTPFQYLRWEPFLYLIEGDNHYDMIMDEFRVVDKPKVFYFFDTKMYDPDKDCTARSDSMNFMEHHGTKRRGEVHYPNFQRFQKDRDSYLKRLVFYLLEKKVDVMFAPGPSINALCHRIKAVLPGVRRMFGLVSNSNERLLQSDASFLMMGYASAVCDHMRCWDGGAGFWTCRHGTYHLMDNLSWCEEIDGKLVSTDYFSLPCPFVRYWNGDFCRITDTYSRCECGRLYRDFEFLENRPFSVKGRSILEIKKTMQELGIINLKRLTCNADCVVVTSFSPISEAKQNIIRSRHRIDFKFLVEK